MLVDLDIQFGDVANALNLEPEYQLPQMVRGDAARDTMVLKTYLTLHPTGLYVVCGPESPIEADGIDGEMVGHLLDQLAAEFRFVVVDTAPGLSEHTLAAMDHTTDLVLLTSMDVHGVRGLRKELDTLDDLGMFTDARHIVLNFAENGRGSLDRRRPRHPRHRRRPGPARLAVGAGVGQPGDPAPAERHTRPGHQGTRQARGALRTAGPHRAGPSPSILGRCTMSLTERLRARHVGDAADDR